MDHLILIGLPGALAAAVFALLQSIQLSRSPSGEESLRQCAGQLRQEVRPYLLGQSLAVIAFAAVGFGALAAFAAVGLLDRFVPWAFLSGTAMTLFTALLSTRTVFRAAPRTATAARDTLNKAMSAAFSAGTVISFTVAALSLTHATIWFWSLRHFAGYEAVQIARAMLPFGLGALLSELLIQLSGGLLSRTTLSNHQIRDAGSTSAELPALATDLLGTRLSVLPAAFALGAAAFPNNGVALNAMLLPIATAVAGILCSLVGVSRIQGDEVAGQRSLLKTLHQGALWSGILTAVVMAPITYLLLGSWRPYVAILAGIAAGCALPSLTEFFTAPHHRPGKLLAKSARLNAAATALEGLTLGLGTSATAGCVTLLAALVGFFALGGNLTENATPGLYGLSLALVGILSTTSVTLATGAGAPVAHCAIQAAKTSEMDEESLTRLATLEGLGRITLPTVRGFAACTGGLSALCLLFCCGGFIGSDFPALAVGAILGAVFSTAFGCDILSRFRQEANRSEGSFESGVAVKPSVPLPVWNILREILPTALSGVLVPVVTGFLLGRPALLGLSFGVLISDMVLGCPLSAAGWGWGNLRRANLIVENPPVLTADALGVPLRSGLGTALPALTKLCAGITVLFWVIG